MDIWGHLEHVLPNAEWDLIRWLVALLGASMLTALTSLMQRLRNGALDWWIIGGLFTFSIVGFYILSGVSPLTTMPMGTLVFCLSAIIVPVLLCLTVGRRRGTENIAQSVPALALTPHDHRNGREQFMKSFYAYKQLFEIVNQGMEQEFVYVRIIYVDQEEISFAYALHDHFMRSGYQDEVPPIQEPLTHIQGMEVHGCNGELVDNMTRALRSAGFLDARPIVERPSVDQENDQWDKEQHSLRIVIGHCA